MPRQTWWNIVQVRWFWCRCCLLQMVDIQGMIYQQSRGAIKQFICLDWLITELSLRNATKCNTSRSRRKSLECSTPTVAYIFTAVEIRLLEYQLFWQTRIMLKTREMISSYQLFAVEINYDVKSMKWNLL